MLWTFRADDDIQSGVTLSADGRSLFVGSRDNNIYALDTASGTLTWKFSTGRAITANAVVAASLVLIGSEDSHFYALDAATGASQSARRPLSAHWVCPDRRAGAGKHAWNVTAAGPLSFIDCSLSPNMDAVYFRSHHPCILRP